MGKQYSNQTPQRPPHLDLLGSGPAQVSQSLAVSVQELVEKDQGIFASLLALPTWLRIATASGVVGALSLAILLATPRPDLATYPAWRMALAVGIFAVMAFFSLQAALRPLSRPRYDLPRRMALTVAILSAPLVMSVLPDAHSGALLQFHFAESFFTAAVSCFLFGGITGAPFVLAAYLLDRTNLKMRRDLVFAGGAAALTGNLTLQFHCPLTDPLHLVLGHATVALPFLLASVILRKR